MGSIDYAKELAARKSLDFIEDGMVVGLGTGSTATRFIELLGERVKRGLKIRGIPTSSTSKELAESLSIPVTDLQRCPEIDVAIDGADEIGPGLALIKGGGGALLHEKIVASASSRFIVIADSTKVVTRLGKVPLPVEVIPIASPLVTRKLAEMRIRPTLRRLNTGSEFITEEGNLILDCDCGEIQNPDALAVSLRNIVGGSRARSFSAQGRARSGFGRRESYDPIQKEVAVRFGKDRGIIDTPSNHSVDETVEKLKEILHAKGITLFALVDHSGEAEKVGMKMRPTKLLIFGNPKAGTSVMLAAPSSAIDLPLKILVWEDAERRVWVSYNSAAYLQERHGLSPELLQNIGVVETLARNAAE